MWHIDSRASTASNDASANGSRIASPCRKAARSASPASAASRPAVLICSSLTLTPVTRAPVRDTIRSAGPPTPQPRSSTWDSVSTRIRSAHTSVNRSIASSMEASESGVSQ